MHSFTLEKNVAEENEQDKLKWQRLRLKPRKLKGLKLFPVRIILVVCLCFESVSMVIAAYFTLTSCSIIASKRYFKEHWVYSIFLAIMAAAMQSEVVF